MRFPAIPLTFALALLAAAASLASDISLQVTSRMPPQAPGADEPAPTVNLPGERDLYLLAPTATLWVAGQALSGTLVWPAEAPTNTQLLAFLKDRDGFWFQTLWPRPLAAGTNDWRFDFDAQAAWTPVGHHAVWNLRTRLTPRFVGVRLFGEGVFTGRCALAASLTTGEAAPASTPPRFRLVQANGESLPCFTLFELRFELPDRYADPYDPACIDVAAVIETPDGRTNIVSGFYTQDYFRLCDAVGETRVPQGRPGWRVRYTPTLPGVHRYTLIARDALGTGVWGPATFEARPSDAPGFVRVSKRDPRHFEVDNDRPFFPIGHNIRSPFDTRMDEQFPWRFRHPEGTQVYARYFADMQAAGENLVEVWMCSWSLGLEWSPKSPGYHGAGDYHLGNAWDLDEVLREARARGLRVNLVLNNHGRASSWIDEEWQDHPYNLAAGGFARSPYDFFNHPEALALQRKLLRYTVARWGWDSTIFAWELWSELDLCGDETSKARAHFDPRVVAWHVQMGDYLRRIDPNRHLIATHISRDYTAINPALWELPQLDHCAVDAYHFSRDPLQIVRLVSATAASHEKFGKPVLITEFGGSPMAAGVEHLRRELHAALWASATTPLAGTPLFWWWQLVEEQKFYGSYRAVSRFMADVDRRDPALRPASPRLTAADGKAVPESAVDSLCLSSPALLLGWIFAPPRFADAAEEAAAPLTDLRLRLEGLPDGIYRFEFWDTREGQVVRRVDSRVESGALEVALPPFARDLAFKARPLPPAK